MAITMNTRQSMALSWQRILSAPARSALRVSSLAASNKEGLQSSPRGTASVWRCSPFNLRHRPTGTRWFGTGTRGARGHGWYVNYRAGKGGRHLQGEYHDRESVEHCLLWNQAVLELGSRRLYLDVLEMPSSSSAAAVFYKENEDNAKKNLVLMPSIESILRAADEEGLTKHRLVMDVAATVMPRTVDNFVQLCTLPESEYGYKGTLLYRVERDVGISGGDVLSNTGKTGKSAPEPDFIVTPGVAPNPLRRNVHEDPLAMWHAPGTVTMLVASVQEVDSRFILCTDAARHMDGIHRAFGMLTAESLDTVRKWKKSVLTHKGKPVSSLLAIVDCGVLENDDEQRVDAEQTVSENAS